MYFEIDRQSGAALGLLASAIRGEWIWRLKAANHEIIASGEGYKNKIDCQHAINLIKGTTIMTPVKDLTLGVGNALARSGAYGNGLRLPGTK